MKKYNYVPFALAIVYLVVAILLASQKATTTNSTTTNAATAQQAATSDMRGIWVSYITLDMQNTDGSESVFRTKINQITSKAKSSGFNTLIFQVRPFSDALYKSDIYPWSHILTGTQGKNPGYDPLEIICDICHKSNIYVHAWVNPYRVSTKESPSQLSSDNPYVKDPLIGFEYDNAKYLDPSNTKAQKTIVNGIKEIVSNYDVDGIQFDDYFYPEGYDNDNKQYEEYKSNEKNPLSKEKWRMQNVNNLIKQVYSTVHKYSDNAVFGISPQGNLNNNYDLGADVTTWCKETGYIDYICPQIYFSLDNPALTFEDSVSQWVKIKKNSNLKMYVGLAGYKGGTDADDGTWLDNDDILKTEIEISKNQGFDGIMLYSYESFTTEDNNKEILNVINYLNDST